MSSFIILSLFIVPALAQDCSSLVPLEDYDLPLHIASVFILVFVSLVGSLSPVLFNAKVPKMVSRIGLLFGAVFVPSLLILTNPCLGTLFSEDYTAFAGVFAIIAMLSLQLIQLVLTSFYRASLVSVKSTDTLDHDVSRHELSHTQAVEECETHAHILNKRITVTLLEIGIASHSIIIGIALGVASGAEFISLLIALSFHQFFEGLALGSTIADAKFKSNLKSILMASVYGITTPLGIGIGIAIHTVYVPNSVEGLLATGILDAMSGGILIYTALVEFLTPELTNSKDFRDSSVLFKGLQLLALYLGVALMAFIGRYA